MSGWLLRCFATLIFLVGAESVDHSESPLNVRPANVTKLRFNLTDFELINSTDLGNWSEDVHPCRRHEDCQKYPEKKSCRYNFEYDRRICSCSLFQIKHGSRCLSEVYPGSPCEIPSQCKGGSFCRNGTCACKEGYYEDWNRCSRVNIWTKPAETPAWEKSVFKVLLAIGSIGCFYALWNMYKHAKRLIRKARDSGRTQAPIAIQPSDCRSTVVPNLEETETEPASATKQEVQYPVASSNPTDVANSPHSEALSKSLLVGIENRSFSSEQQPPSYCSVNRGGENRPAEMIQ